MRRELAVIVLGGLLAALGGCKGERISSTLLLVEIHSDLSFPTQMDRIELVVRRPDGKGETVVPFSLSGTPMPKLPLRDGLIPAAGGESETITLVARAQRGQTTVVSDEAVVEFVNGERRLVRMYLLGICVNSSCSAQSLACGPGGACVPRRRSSLPIDIGDAGTDGRDGPVADRPADLLDGPWPDVADAPGVDTPGGMDSPPDVRCGSAGESCCMNQSAPCSSGLSCQNGTCGTCGALGQGCCGNNVCASGLRCASGLCSACGAIGQPCCADGACLPGSQCRAADQTCQPCGGVGQACCTSAEPCGGYLTCEGGLCRCGGFGQPCCGGTTCAADADRCNGTEVCLATGVCGRTSPVTCTAINQCHSAGICNPVTGVCSNPVRPNGTICNDSNACTGGETCQSGTCTPATYTACSPRVCNSASCDPANGVCVYRPAGDGSLCTTSAGTKGCCSGGACYGGICPQPL